MKIMKIFVKKLLFTTLLVLMSVLGIAQCDSFDCDNVVGRDVEVKHASAPAGTTITAIQGTTNLASGAFTHPQTVTIPCEGATTITLSYPDGRPYWVWNAESCIAENPVVPGEYCVTLSLSGIDGHVLKDGGLVTPIPREDLSCEADLCPPPPTCICDFFLADSKGARIDTVACGDEFIYFSASAPEGCDAPVVDGTTIYYEGEPIGDYPIPLAEVEPGTYTVSLNSAVTSCDNEAQVTFTIPTCSSPCCTAIHLVDGEGNVVADAENPTVSDSYCTTPIYVQCVDNPELEIVSGDVNGTPLIGNQVPEGITSSGTVTASFGDACEVASESFGFPSCDDGNGDPNWSIDADGSVTWVGLVACTFLVEACNAPAQHTVVFLSGGAEVGSTIALDASSNPITATLWNRCAAWSVNPADVPENFDKMEFKCY